MLKHKKPIQIILFSSSFNFDEEIILVSHFLLDKGVIFHIRKPGFSFEELRLYINKIPKEFHAQIVIHQYIDLLNEFNLKGFHCTRFFIKNTNKSLIELKEEFPNSSFSKSCHSLMELEIIEGYSYVFLSPIFDSISKKGYKSKFTLEDLNRSLKLAKIDVYALGGISETNISILKELNIKGVGVLGSIWNSVCPKKKFIKIKGML